MKEDIKKRYVELQLINQHILQLQRQAQLIEEQITEFNNISLSLDDLKKVKIGSKILVPLSSGIFVKARLEDNNELLINVGANVIIKKDVNKTKELVKKQIMELQKAHKKVVKELENLVEVAETIKTELQKLIEKNV